MIDVKEKNKCCGCTACVQVCPKQCIKLQEDNEGFLYPLVNVEKCIRCGLCENVCPELHPLEEREPLKVYAAKNNNEAVRVSSSSGGIFTLIAEQIIDEGGVVFGARFDEHWEVIHDMATTKEDLKTFRGSKYVQSRMGNTYKQVKLCLRLGKKVLFTGTPCQVAGLKHFLRKEYENLLTMDFVCHGVPSPKVWRSYLSEVSQGSKIKNIEFRNKQKGWKNYSFVLDIEGLNKENVLSQSSVFGNNIFMQAFLSNIILRPSCYACPSKCGRSQSDMTMGDFWGIENVLPDFDDDRGCSLLLVHSKKIKSYLSSGNVELKEAAYKDAKRKNPSIYCSVLKPVYRNFFFRQFLLRKEFYKAFYSVFKKSFFFRLRRRVYTIFYR